MKFLVPLLKIMKYFVKVRSLTTLTRRGKLVSTPTGNVNGIQIFPYNSKGIPSTMSTGGR